MKLSGCIALVTGGTSGIGRGLCELLLQNDAKVAVVDINDERGQEVEGTFQEKYGTGCIKFIRCDVSVERDLKDAFSEVIALWGQLDIVCNNAAVLDEENWNKTLNTNLGGVIHGTLLGLDQMKRGSVIVNTSSTADDETVLLEKEIEFLKDEEAFKEKLVAAVQKNVKSTGKEKEKATAQRVPETPVKSQARKGDGGTAAKTRKHNAKAKGDSALSSANVLAGLSDADSLFSQDSGSELESELEIKNKVEKIIVGSERTELDSEESSSHSTLVDISNNQIVGLLYQNLAVSREILNLVKAVSDSQERMMQSINQLVNPSIDCFPQDASVHSEQSLLTMLSQDGPEPQLNLPLAYSQDAIEQNLPPTLGPNLPEQPQQNLNAINHNMETINEEDLRDCSGVHSTRSETSEVCDLDQETLLSLKSQACSHSNFTVKLLRKYFRNEELKGTLSRTFFWLFLSKTAPKLRLSTFNHAGNAPRT